MNNASERFVRTALSYETKVAMLLRSEFASAGGRDDLFCDEAGYAFEVKLTSRPRWDWWFRDKPKSSPRHNYSWFVWDKEWLNNNRINTVYREGKPKK
jgi:hypothetical protein